MTLMDLNKLHNLKNRLEYIVNSNDYNLPQKRIAAWRRLELVQTERRLEAQMQRTETLCDAIDAQVEELEFYRRNR